jgi:uncharacterized repeat protein (TIGR03803 family)
VTFVARFSGNQGSTTGVFQATDGNFYGTAGGGANDQGQLFRMTPAGKLVTIYSFCSLPNCADGESPYPSPILGSDGNLYGVTEGGNANFAGTFYKVTLDGKLTTLYTSATTCIPSCPEGIGLNGITQASDGNFYGTMYAGGNATSSGTIFSISPTGKFTVLYNFCSLANCVDGQNPEFPPIQGSDGNFYGTTYNGGTEGGEDSQGGGVVYQLTPSGTYTVLHSFCGQNDDNCDTGMNPSTVVADAHGNLFGTTVYGLAVAFEITSTHEYRILHTFDSAIDGYYPAGLILASDGNFYGMTGEGGTANEGTIFEMTPAGEFTSLYSFAYPKGYDPSSGLFQATDGSLYGATAYSIFPCCYGTIFSLSNGLSPLVETVPVAGNVGTSVIILGNNLTGSTGVTFNGVEAAFTVESDTYIKATVPKGATTGPVSVVTPSGTLNSNPQFVVTR